MLSFLNGDRSPTRLVEAIAGSSGSLIDPHTSPVAPVAPNAAETNDEPRARATEESDLMQYDGADTGHPQNPTPPTAEAENGDGQQLAGLDGLIPGLGGLDSGLELAGEGTLPQPILNAANSAVLELHAELETLSHQTGTDYLVHGVTELGESTGLGFLGEAPAPLGPTNLITDILNLPANLLAGNIEGIVTNLGEDVSEVLSGVMSLKDQLIFGPDPVNPVPELIQGIGSSLSTLPILTIAGGNEDGNGGLLGGLVGDLSGSSSGHLIDVNAGPEQENGGLPINLLSNTQDDNASTVSVDAVDVGPNGPQLLDLGLLTDTSNLGLTDPGGAGGALGLLNLGGTGGDGLLGILNLDLGAGSTSGPGSVTQQATDALPAHDGGIASDQGANAFGSDHGILDTHNTHLL